MSHQTTITSIYFSNILHNIKHCYPLTKFEDKIDIMKNYNRTIWFVWVLGGIGLTSYRTALYTIYNTSHTTSNTTQEVSIAKSFRFPVISFNLYLFWSNLCQTNWAITAVLTRKTRPSTLYTLHSGYGYFRKFHPTWIYFCPTCAE